MKTHTLDLLRLIADGEFHSGVALARELDVSKGTVWNAVRAIEAAGLGVSRVPGRGYRLDERVTLLRAEDVAAAAREVSQRLHLEIVDEIDSTNSELMRRAAAGAPSGSVVAAESQGSGRGRMGRTWHSGIGRSLAFSMLWRFPQGASGLTGLSLAIGVAVVRALRTTVGVSDVELKWPNDVLWNGRKLAGILVELSGDALGPSAVVIGIGVNVRLSKALKASIDQPATDLETACGSAVDRNAVLGALLRELCLVLDAFATSGFAPLRKEWERYHAHQGQRVTVTLPGGGSDSGIARGIADDGALIFESASTLRRLHSGEISVRTAP